MITDGACPASRAENEEIRSVTVYFLRGIGLI